MTATPLIRYAGDDWRGANAFAFTYASPGVGGAPGSPIDLTGYVPSGIFFFAGGQAVLTVGNSRAALTDAVNGKFTLSLEAALTARLAAQTSSAQTSINRLQVMLTDPAGDLFTLAVVPIMVLPPGTVYP